MRDLREAGAADRPFRVRVENLADLEIVSSMLQDAIVPVRELTYDRRNRRFVMIAQRFRWEAGPAADRQPAEPVYERIHCAVRINDVDAAQTNGLDLADRGQVLELLSFNLSDGRLHLCFAGARTIGLTIARLSGLVEDIGEAWPTTGLPVHPDVTHDGE